MWPPAPVLFVIERLRRKPAPETPACRLGSETLALLFGIANTKQAHVAGLSNHSGSHAARLAAPISPMPVMAMPAVMIVAVPPMMIVGMPAHLGRRPLGVLRHRRGRARGAH